MLNVTWENNDFSFNSNGYLVNPAMIIITLDRERQWDKVSASHHAPPLHLIFTSKHYWTVCKVQLEESALHHFMKDGLIITHTHTHSLCRQVTLLQRAASLTRSESEAFRVNVMRTADWSSLAELLFS